MLYYVIYKYNVYVYIYMSIYSTFYPHDLRLSACNSARDHRRAVLDGASKEKTARRKRLEPGKSVEICGNLWKSHGKSVKYGKITRDSLVFAVLPRFYMILATKIWGGSCNSYNQEADSCLGLWIGSE